MSVVGGVGWGTQGISGVIFFVASDIVVAHIFITLKKKYIFFILTVYFYLTNPKNNMTNLFKKNINRTKKNHINIQID